MVNQQEFEGLTLNEKLAFLFQAILTTQQMIRNLDDALSALSQQLSDHISASKNPR